MIPIASTLVDSMPVRPTHRLAVWLIASIAMLVLAWAAASAPRSEAGTNYAVNLPIILRQPTPTPS